MTHLDTKNAIENSKNFAQVDDALDRTYCQTQSQKADYLSQMFSLPRRTDYRTAVMDVLARNRALAK